MTVASGPVEWSQLPAALNAATITSIATGGSTARSLAARGADVVNVKDFGAVGDDSTDDTAAINAALAYARASSSTNYYMRVLFPVGRYKTTGPINMTGFGTTSDFLQSLVVDGWGATIDCQMAGSTAAVDMLGSRWITINGLTIYGNPSFVPTFGLQLGRIANAQAADIHTFNRIRVIGNFAKSAIYNLASESNLWDNIYVENHTTTNAYGLILDSSNNFSCTSTFVTQTITAGAIQSMFENHFVSGTIISQSTNTSVVWMNGSGKTAFDTTFISTSAGTTGITLSVTDAGNPIRMLRCDCHIENNPNLANIFLITGASSKNIMGLMYRDQQCQASSSIFKLDTGVTSVSIFNLEIDVPTTWDSSPYPTVFDTPADYTVTGSIKIPNPSCWVYPNSFTGDILFGSDANAALTKLVYANTQTVPVSGNRGDANQTIVWGVDSPIQIFSTTLTANRTVTLSTTGAVNGAQFKIVRTGLGSFTLAVGSAKTIPSATAAYVEVTYNGSSWVETGYGVL